MPTKSLKTILNRLALEHGAFKTKHLKQSVLRHGIRLNFSSDNPPFCQWDLKSNDRKNVSEIFANSAVVFWRCIKKKESG